MLYVNVFSILNIGKNLCISCHLSSKFILMSFVEKKSIYLFVNSFPAPWSQRNFSSNNLISYFPFIFLIHQGSCYSIYSFPNREAVFPNPFTKKIWLFLRSQARSRIKPCAYINLIFISFLFQRY